ncbi:MAG: TspO/MBR family protein [Pseudomonadota bacterium]
MKYLTLIPFLAVVAVVAVTGAMFKPGAWYAALAKPAWTPPGWLFGPVWTLLYLMIAVAGWLIWQRAGNSAVFWVWVVQLACNMAWSWIMFGLHQIGWAFADIVLLWFAIVLFVVLAWPISQTAALLFIPYLAWVSFAAALNFTIWRLNIQL